MRDAVAGDLRIGDFQKLSGLVDAARPRLAGLGLPEVRIAVLGGYTTQPIVALLPAVALAEGRVAVVHEAPYDTFRTEALDPSSATRAFTAEIALLATSSANLTHWPAPGAAAAEVAALLDRTEADWSAIWAGLAASGAQVIQHSVDPPAQHPLGRVEARLDWSPRRFVAALNDRWWARDGRGVRILDVAALAERAGTERWVDPRFYFHSKHGFSPALAAPYARALGGLLRALWGRARKCLVLDLDQVMWGGVIGDDGLDGIALGPGAAEGEAYEAFQRYVRALADRGVVLAACSRNDPGPPRSVFERHPHAALSLDHFAAFVCNWEPKPDNLRAIAATLNIGLDAMVFADDDPVECASVTRALPDVWVVPMAGDPSSFPARLDWLHLFDTLALTGEDLARAGSYAAAASAPPADGSPGGLDAFLASLDMHADVRPAAEGEMPRIEQLFGKTNQFNLTGQRFTQDELAAVAADRSALCLVATLSDRFTRYGLVSALVAHVSGDSLVVDNWVTSCRVFSRTFEDHVAAGLGGAARARGCREVRGTFLDTGRNGYVRGWLERRGWLAADGTWRIDASAPQPSPHIGAGPGR